MFKKMSSLALSFTIGFSSLPSDAFAAGMEEEVLFGEIGEMPGVLTAMKRENVPVSVTTITEEDIKLTPARNIFDLVEIYVPGALWTFHNETPHMAIRGLGSDRETKTLLLVNGV